MKLHKHFILTLALAATVLGVTASRAKAGAMYNATFSLPVEAYWGSTLMHPGDYSISMEWDYAGSSLVYLRGDDVHAVILTGSVNLENASERSHLTLEEVNGTYVVRELKAGTLGKDFRFGVSKAVRRQTDRASTGAPINVAVAAGGGN
jgi:hypothetical protein